MSVCLSIYLSIYLTLSLKAINISPGEDFFLKHKFKGKVIKNFKTTIMEH